MNKPVKTVKDGVMGGMIELAIWARDYEGKTSYSFSFQRSYKDKDDKWQNTNFMRKSDLLVMKELITKVYQKNIKEYVAESKPRPKQESNSNDNDLPY